MHPAKLGIGEGTCGVFCSACLVHAVLVVVALAPTIPVFIIVWIALVGVVVQISLCRIITHIFICSFLAVLVAVWVGHCGGHCPGGKAAFGDDALILPGSGRINPGSVPDGHRHRCPCLRCVCFHSFVFYFTAQPPWPCC